MLSKIVFFDLQKSIFFCPAGAIQRGSVCTLSLIEPVQCVSERSLEDPLGVALERRVAATVSPNPKLFGPIAKPQI